MAAAPAKTLLLGITGTLGAGKGTVVEYLTRKGFKHYSVRSFLTLIIEKRGMEVCRPSMVTVANELRKENGPAAIVEALLDQAKRDLTNEPSAGAIIESIRTPGEVQALRVAGKGNERVSFRLLAVDADQRTRYDRVVQRKSATDSISFEEFQADEAKEMNSDEPHKQNLGECIRQADHVLMNNGSVAELEQQVCEALGL